MPLNSAKSSSNDDAVAGSDQREGPVFAGNHSGAIRFASDPATLHHASVA